MGKYPYKSLDDLLSEIGSNEEAQREYWRQSPLFDVAQEIIDARIRRGLTQEQLADVAGTHQSRISKLESGTTDVRLSTLIQIAEALKTHVKVQLMDGFEVAEEGHYNQVLAGTVTISERCDTSTSVPAVHFEMSSKPE